MTSNGPCRQVAEQDSLTCLPLIMEPEGRLYTSPVVVLDFRSLYPSVMNSDEL